MNLEVEKRLAPRIETKSAVGLSLKDREGNLVNISETGVCFECNGAILSGDIQLSLAVFPDKSRGNIPMSARVVHHVPLAGNRNRYGVQFSSPDTNFLFRMRDIIFDQYAKKALAEIEITGQDQRKAIEDFFKKDVRGYHENLVTMVRETEDGKLDSEEIEKKLAALTDGVLLEGLELEKKLGGDEMAMKSIKRVFREAVGGWFYKSPIVKMAYDKPRGYPGDYLLFDKIYDNRSQSEKGTIGYYCDRYFLQNTYAQAARARKNKMKNILQDQIENSNLPSIRLLNVACGPSREIRELLCDPYLAQRKNIVFTGLDYDEEALKFSQDKFKSLPPNVQVRLIHANVLNISRDPKYYDLIGKQDIIYILGLTEYLPERIFRKLIQFLFKLLNNKGMLVITYKDQAIEYPSLPPEWFCDWGFIKRTKEDLLKTAEEIGSNQFSLKIEREGTGTIFFFMLTKK